MAAEPEGKPAGPGLAAETLGSMTVAQLKALAAGAGYTLSKTRKADMIAKILEQQGGETRADP